MNEFDCDGPISVTIRMSAGEADIVAEDRSSVSVDVTPNAPGAGSRSAAEETQVEMRDGMLLIETPQAHAFVVRRAASLRIRVHVPTGSRLEFHSASGDLRCTGGFAHIDASTASGDVQVDHVTGDMTRNGASGDTEFKRVDGDLSLHSASGDVRGGTVGGSLTSRSASGDVRIDRVAESVRAQSASGEIEIGCLASGAARINSVSGDVTLGVAEGTSVWLDLNSVSGDTRSDLTMSDTGPASGVAALNLHVRTVSGDIRVGRAMVARATARPHFTPPAPPAPPTPPSAPTAPAA